MTDPLSVLVRELRAELADARWFRFHSRVVPSSTEAIQLSKWDPIERKWQPNWDETVEVLDAGEGMSLSPAAERYLEGRGVDALPQRSLEEIGWMCHVRHGAHCEADGCPEQGPPARTPLCERVARGMLRLDGSLIAVADNEKRATVEVREIAIQALRHARAWRHRQLHTYMRAARELERDTRVICPLCLGRTVSMRPGRVA